MKRGDDEQVSGGCGITSEIDVMEGGASFDEHENIEMNAPRFPQVVCERTPEEFLQPQDFHLQGQLLQLLKPHILRNRGRVIEICDHDVKRALKRLFSAI
jgi:hypothetical protein